MSQRAVWIGPIALLMLASGAWWVMREIPPAARPRLSPEHRSAPSLTGEVSSAGSQERNGHVLDASPIIPSLRERIRIVNDSFCGPRDVLHGVLADCANAGRNSIMELLDAGGLTEEEHALLLVALLRLSPDVGTTDFLIYLDRAGPRALAFFALSTSDPARASHTPLHEIVLDALAHHFDRLCCNSTVPPECAVPLVYAAGYLSPIDKRFRAILMEICLGPEPSLTDLALSMLSEQAVDRAVEDLAALSIQVRDAGVSQKLRGVLAARITGYWPLLTLSDAESSLRDADWSEDARAELLRAIAFGAFSDCLCASFTDRDLDELRRLVEQNTDDGAGGIRARVQALHESAHAALARSRYVSTLLQLMDSDATGEVLGRIDPEYVAFQPIIRERLLRVVAEEGHEGKRAEAARALRGSMDDSVVRRTLLSHLSSTAVGIEMQQGLVAALGGRESAYSNDEVFRRDASRTATALFRRAAHTQLKQNLASLIALDRDEGPRVLRELLGSERDPSVAQSIRWALERLETIQEERPARSPSR